jgi:hypothetical protein
MLLQLVRRYSAVSLTGLVMVGAFQPLAIGAAPADIG